MKSAILPVTVAALLLSACGSREGYPSLERRPAERITGSAPVVTVSPAPAAAPIPPDLATQSRLARLQAQARDAHARFSALVPDARRMVSAAQGAAMASESWAVANVALASLESRRSEAMVALADLDALYVKDRVDGGDGTAIAEARDSVTAWVAAEDAVLADLRGRIAG